MSGYTIITGDVLATLPTLGAASVHCVVTSPPYWALRDYGMAGQLGSEATMDCLGWATGAKCGACYICRMTAVFREVGRALRDDGTCWVNMGDSYAHNGPCGGGSALSKPFDGRIGDRSPRGRQTTMALSVPRGLKPKDMCGVPWRLALSMQADGWYLRSDIIWHKPAPMPESAKDRPTKSHEYLFLFTKSERYFYDAEAIKEPVMSASLARQNDGRVNQWGHIIDANQHVDSRGHDEAKSYGPRDGPLARNRRSVWTIASQPYAEAHFATFPEKLVEPCVLAGTSGRGCCAQCGKGWERVTERTAIKRTRPNDFVKRTGKAGTGNSCANSVAGVSVKTVGWQPACSCIAGKPVPCLVLDPFSGSGTTGAVACKHGRVFVGLELNPEYVAMAQQRIGRATRPATFADTRVIDSPLFAAGVVA